MWIRRVPIKNNETELFYSPPVVGDKLQLRVGGQVVIIK